MHAVTDAGHNIVMHVQDEIVIDEPTESGLIVADACEFMSTLPAWAEAFRWMRMGMSVPITARIKSLDLRDGLAQEPAQGAGLTG